MFSELASDTACVLVSCMYFKGDWYDKFKSYKTRDATFYCKEDKTSTVKMMTKKDCYSYLSVDEKGFKCVRIPYKLQDFGMLIILPDERFGLKNVIKKLDVKTIENIKDDENFNSVLIKKLNVNKGNAFSVKKKLFQVGEIES